MFDIAWSEFLVVAVVALVVVGPKDLPPLLRTVGRMMRQVRRMAGDFQNQFNEAMREAELDDLRKEVTGLRDSAKRLMNAPDPLTIARDEIKGAIEGKPSALAGTETPTPEAPSALAPEPLAPEPIAEAPAPTVEELAPPAKANGAAHPAAAEAEPVARPTAPGGGA